MMSNPAWSIKKALTHLQMTDMRLRSLLNSSTASTWYTHTCPWYRTSTRSVLRAVQAVQWHDNVVYKWH